MKTEWWEPQLVDHEFCERLRKDYPEDAHLDDESIAEEYEYTFGEFATTWDHTGDAYEQFQPLAKAYCELRSENARLRAAIEQLKQELCAARRAEA